MTKSFIASILAASIAITSISVVPARADAEDIAKVLLGLAVIAGIAAVIDDNDPAPVRVTPPPRRDRRNFIPARCVRNFYSDRGERRGVGARCMDRFAPRVNLPHRCERRWSNGRGGRRTAYALRCLRREGFQVVGRR